MGGTTYQHVAVSWYSVVLCPLHEETLRAAASWYEARHRKLRERQLGTFPELGVYWAKALLREERGSTASEASSVQERASVSTTLYA